MRTVIVVCCPDKDLDVEAIRSMHDLMTALHADIGRDHVRIIASPSKRGKSAAEIAAQRYSTDPHNFEENSLLWTDRDGEAFATADDLEVILTLISKSNPLDHVMLIADRDFTSGFPNFFGRKYLDVHLRGGEIPRNTAWVIDCESKEIRHVCCAQRTLQHNI